ILVATRGEDAPDAGLFQHVIQLALAVRGIEVDQNQAQAMARVGHDRPLPAVRRPNADAVTISVAGAYERRRQPIDLLAELPVGQAHVGEYVHDRLTVGDPPDLGVEGFPERVGAQRRRPLTGAYSPARAPV